MAEDVSGGSARSINRSPARFCSPERSGRWRSPTGSLPPLDSRRRTPLVHRRDGDVPADGRTLGAGAGGEVRSATEPGLRPPHPLPGLLSGARLNLGAAATNPAVCTDSEGDAR